MIIWACKNMHTSTEIFYITRKARCFTILSTQKFPRSNGSKLKHIFIVLQHYMCDARISPQKRNKRIVSSLRGIVTRMMMLNQSKIWIQKYNPALNMWIVKANAKLKATCFPVFARCSKLQLVSLIISSFTMPHSPLSMSKLQKQSQRLVFPPCCT